MSLAAETREAVRRRPFLLDALRAGVVNYAAAARRLDVSDDTEAVAAALRRFTAGLPDYETDARTVRVTMHAGIEPATDGALLSVDGTGFAPGDGDHTGLLATGDVGPETLAHAVGVLEANEVASIAAGAVDGALAVVVDRRDGPTGVRLLEAAFAAAPR